MTLLCGEQDFAGSTIANAGDVDGDGLDDILIGALKYHTESPYQGAAYVVLGRSLGLNRDMDLSDADYILVGSERDYAGVSVACAGDVDGDGLDDVVLGAYGGPDWNGVHCNWWVVIIPSGSRRLSCQ